MNTLGMNLVALVLLLTPCRASLPVPLPSEQSPEDRCMPLVELSESTGNEVTFFTLDGSTPTNCASGMAQSDLEATAPERARWFTVSGPDRIIRRLLSRHGSGLAPPPAGKVES